MRLAEALAERGDCQKRIEEVKKRLLRSARIQEGEQPPEDPSELIAEAGRLLDRLLHLIQAINRTNAQIRFDAQRNISDAIAERDIVGKRRDLFISLTDAASTRQDRYSKSEFDSSLRSPSANCKSKPINSPNNFANWIRKFKNSIGGQTSSSKLVTNVKPK